VAQVDPEVAASSARTLEAVWLASLGPRRAQVRVLQVFGDAALLLCALGVYGVAVFSARTRRRELAIRTALGATRRELTISMLRREIQPVLVGLAIGLAAALILAPVLFAGAFAIDPHDSKTYALVTATLLGVAAVATYLPVRRAAAASPSGALSPD
jgi:putative ABC transport system permease protein